ncbi:MAG: hypothetical protein NVSMB19_08860 [Vulcanimicrobiaceae bacterium]
MIRTDALVAGAAGAVTTNVLHEIVRRVRSDAPRVDLLGMQALAKSADALGAPPPRGRALYLATLAGDLASNTVYFALAGTGGRSKGAQIGLGIALGAIAGAGAVVLPRPLGLTTTTTARTRTTSLLTIALYTAGGCVAGVVARALASGDAEQP